MRVRLRTPLGVSVLLVDDNSGRRSMFEGLLVDSGYEVVGSVGAEVALDAAARRAGADIVVANHSCPDAPFLRRLEAFSGDDARPVVLFSEDDRDETIRSAVAAGVSHYVVVGLNANRVRTAIDTARAHFDDVRQWKRAAADACAALEERKLVERAKGILMKQRSLDEAEAYAILRRTAMQRNQRMADLARTITDAAALITGSAAPRQ
jgi:response regulator NasT